MNDKLKFDTIQKIIKVLDDNKDFPAFYKAQRIVTEVLEKIIDEQRDVYERLFYTDTDTKN